MMLNAARKKVCSLSSANTPFPQMENEQKFEYIKIPVSLIPELYRGRSGFIDVMSYCFYRASAEMDFDPNNVAKRIVYEYVITKKEKRKVQLPARIVNLLDELDEETEFVEWSEDYRGFYPYLHGDFDPADCDDNLVIDKVEEILSADDGLWDLATDYYCIAQVAKLLKVTCKDVDAIRRIHLQYKTHDRCKAWAWVKFSKLMELANRGEELKAEDIEVYAAHLALKSIIGKKKVGRTESKLVLARMAGCVSSDDCTSEYLSDNPIVARVHKKYSDKDNYRRLMGRLREGFVKFIETIPGKNRLGMFFSYSRDLPKYLFEEEVMKIVEKDKKEAAKIKKRRQRRQKKMGCRPAKGIDLKAHEIPNNLPF